MGEVIDPAIPPPSEIIAITEFSASTFRGPLPPPLALREYSEIIPGGAERIMRMAENAAAHRRDMERRRLDLERDRLQAQREDARAERRERLVGQVGGFLLGMAGLSVTFWLCLHDHAIAGSAAGLGTVVSLVGMYMYGRTPEAAPSQQPDEESTDAADRLKAPVTEPPKPA